MSQRVEVGPSLADRRFRRILLVKPSSLGDVIHGLPVLHGLRVRYPSASISWLIVDTIAPLIAAHPDLDEVILFDRRRYGRFGRSLDASAEFLRFLRTLRARQFDLAIDLQGLFRSGLLTMASGAPVRIGFAGGRELSSVFYTHRIRADRSRGSGELHAAEKNYLVSPMLGFADVPMAFDLAVTVEERGAADRLLDDAGIAPGERFVAVLPGARWETKRWRPDRFASTIDAVGDRCGVRSVLMGSGDERSIGDQINAASRSSAVDLIGRTGLREMVAVLDRASVVLAHDSAPMHVAAALDRPMVALLGPTNRARTGPYGSSASTVLQSDLPCVPCYFRRLSQCPHGHQCMTEMTVENVTGAVVGLLADTHETKAAGRTMELAMRKLG